MRSVNIIRAPFAVVPCTVPRTSPARHNACMAHPVRGAHTFLFEPGVWTSTGTLWRADGEPLEAVGRTEIAPDHSPSGGLLLLKAQNIYPGQIMLERAAPAAGAKAT